jgi:hypothetical protein
MLTTCPKEPTPAFTLVDAPPPPRRGSKKIYMNRKGRDCSQPFLFYLDS